MKKELFLILIVICSLTHVIRLIYEILKHKQVLKAGKVSFIIVFTDMIILWISWFLLCKFDIFKVNLPDFLRYIGISLVGIGIVSFLAGLFTIKTLESYDGGLITTGIYSIVRHPMYLGFILWLVGFPIFFEGYFSMILSLFFIANVLFWRNLEEKELENRFPAYLEYRKKTIF